jgi:acetyl-CoA synthetase
MEEHYEFGGEIVWRPTDDYIQHSRLKAFMDQHGIATFEELMRRSTDDLEWFWHARC